MKPIVLDYIAGHARVQPNKLATVDLATSRRWTYAQFDDAIDRAAHVLKDMDVGAGDRVAMLSRNSVDMLIAHFACVRIGAIFVPLNWRLAAPEVAFLIEDCAPRLLIFESLFEQLVPEWYDRARMCISPECNALAEAMAAAPRPANPGQGVAVDPETPITLLYSSGTTGRPKGVVVTQLNAFAGGLNLTLSNRVTHDSVFLCDMPLFHTAGLMAAARVPLFMGGTVLISQKFDAVETYQRLSDPELGVTHYFSVPQMGMMMRQLPGFDGRRLAHLTAYITGGAPNPAAHIHRWLDDGVEMLNGWGMSETCSALNAPPGDMDLLRKKAGSVGLALLSCEIRLVDEQGNDVPAGTVGEIWIRGANVTPGYWNRPEQNAKSFIDGWFRTGDAAYVDEDGFYTLVDRIKDMFISGGENVYPAEIEAAITEMESVGEVAVIGVADERWGEVGCAFVVPATGRTLSDIDVLEFCNQRLARYKIPKSVVITTDIPRNAAGKVLKQTLRDRMTEARELTT